MDLHERSVERFIEIAGFGEVSEEEEQFEKLGKLVEVMEKMQAWARSNLEEFEHVVYNGFPKLEKNEFFDIYYALTDEFRKLTQKKLLAEIEEKLLSETERLKGIFSDGFRAYAREYYSGEELSMILRGFWYIEKERDLSYYRALSEEC